MKDAMMIVFGFVAIILGTFLVLKCSTDKCIEKKCPEGLSPHYTTHTGCTCVVLPK